MSTERQKRYVAARKERLASDPVFRAEFRRKEAARHAEWRERNARATSEINRRSYQNNKSAIDAYRRANVAMRRACDARRRARKLGSDGSYTAQDVEVLLVLQRWRCVDCGASLRGGYQIDHIEPLARGGSNEKTNVQLLCRPCNQRKSSKDPIVHAQSLGRLF